MMISPDSYIENLKDKTYKELLKERELLLEEIKLFENNPVIDDEEILVCPTPEVVYQCNLLYLGKLFELIAEKYNNEVIGENEEE